MNKIAVYTDASCDSTGRAAAACILDDPGQGVLWKSVCVFNCAEAAEAETWGALLAVVMLRGYGFEAGGTALIGTDSEAVIAGLRSRELRAKGAGLWGALFQMSGSWELELRHIPAHNGHPRNEACDRAARWIRLKGLKLLEAYGPGRVGRLAPRPASWLLLDARGWSEKIRAGGEGAAALVEWEEALKADLAEMKKMLVAGYD